MNKEIKREKILLVVLFVSFVLMSIIEPSKFLSINNIQSMFFQMPEFGILSIAMMVVVITGGINLSITAVAALAGILSGFVLSMPFSMENPILGILIAICVSILFALLSGGINGVFISYVGVPAILVTLSTSTLFEGVSLKLTKGGAISGFPSEFFVVGNGEVFSIPVAFIIYFLVIVVTFILLEKSVWGSRVYMIGNNAVASRYSGVKVKKILTSVYVYSSILAVTSSIIMISRYNSAKVDYGSSYLLQSIAAIVLGGTSITGGKGSVWGTVLAVAILQVISSGFNIIGVNRYFVDVTMGLILIGVLILNYVSVYFRKKNLRKSTSFKV